MNAFCPLWDDGSPLTLAVSGSGAVSSEAKAVLSWAVAAAFVTACPLKGSAFLPRMSRMKSGPSGTV